MTIETASANFESDSCQMLNSQNQSDMYVS